MYPAVYEESDPAEVYVLYWGNFILHHSVTTMVRATASLPYWEFLLAGERTERNESFERWSPWDSTWSRSLDSS